MVKTSRGRSSWGAARLQMCSARALAVPRAGEAPPKRGPECTPKALGGSSEAHAAALLPGSRAVARVWGWPPQAAGGDPTRSLPALPESQNTRLPLPATGTGGDRHPRSLQPPREGRIDRQPCVLPRAWPLVPGSWTSPAAASASRISRETSALRKPNHNQGHDLAYHIPRAGDTEGKANHSGDAEGSPLAPQAPGVIPSPGLWTPPAFPGQRNAC